MTAFLAFIDDAAHLGIDDPTGWRACKDKLKGHEVIVELKKRPRRQGNQSMKYLRGVVIPDIAKACGVSDPDDYADVFEALMLKFRPLPDGLFGLKRRQSTAKDAMSQEEITALIDELIIYGETTIPGCAVRRPEDVDMDRVHDPEWS